MDGDPTMAFLRSFDDPTKWVIKRNVPIFKPHRRVVKQADGSEVEVVVTADDLPQIAENMRRLEYDHGVAARLTAGHITGQPEHQQPVLFGFTRLGTARAGTFGPKNEPAVLTDEYLFPAKAAEREAYPYRSPEYYPGQKVIRGVALLKRDPFLDLGVVYSAPDGHCHSYAAEVNPMTTPATPTAEEAAQLDALVPKHLAYCLQKFNLQPAGKPADPNALPEPVRMQLDQMRVNYENTVAQHAATTTRLQTELEAIRYERDQERCERQVIQLEAEGYQLGDRSRMVGRLAKMDEATRAAEIEHIRVCYARVPVTRPGEQIVPATGTEGGTQAKAQQEHYERAMAHVRANPGMTLQAAYDATKQ